MESEFENVEGREVTEPDAGFGGPSEDVLRVEEKFSAGVVESGSSKVPFIDNVFRTRFLQVLLVAGVVLACVSLFAGFLEYNFLKDVEIGRYATDEEAMAVGSKIDLFSAAVGLTHFGIIILIIIIFMLWLYRANKNTSALTGEPMVYSPGWTVGWFFIPFANLWKPYQAVKDIWDTCADHSEMSGGWFVGFWWTVFLVDNALGRAAGKSAFRAEELDELIRANVLCRISDGVEIISSILMFILVSRIFMMQEVIKGLNAHMIDPDSLDPGMEHHRINWRGL